MLGSAFCMATSATAVAAAWSLKPVTAHASFFNWGKSPAAPEPYRQNRIYFPVRYESEFEPLLLLKTPLLANFTFRGDPKSDKLTGAFSRIVSEETEFRVSAVDVEADEQGTRELLVRYSVTELPMIVAFRGGVPYAKFTLPKDFTKDSEIDWIALKAWIESVADKPL
ncbi:conserved hypothetical protein [Geotrichum candidum]|uniref:Thioredoxin domain-containing protein n=1 Tax=Geotrichum candidum TaxID=1173061 RepID=A0A0J9XHM6_GEOCN|nr:conserved hypothetical protein [Geotrichum candidum]